MDDIEVPGVEGIKDTAHAVVADFQTPRKHIWLLLIIGGGLVALALLIKHSAQKIAPATPASASTTPSTINFSETLNQPPPTTTAVVMPPKTPPPPPLPTPYGKPPGQPMTYVVEAGDTLGSIAAKFGVTLAQLEAAPGNYTVIFNTAHKNGFHSNEWSHIQAGEMIYIPAKG